MEEETGTEDKPKMQGQVSPNNLDSLEDYPCCCKEVWPDLSLGIWPSPKHYCVLEAGPHSNKSEIKITHLL